MVGVLYSLTSVLGKAALQYVSPLFFGSFYFALLGVASLVMLSAREARAITVLWRRPRAHLLVGSMMAVMVVTHYLAIQMIEVAYMITVKRTSLLFGIVYGALLFSEPRVIPHLAAGALMVAGVFLVVV